MITRRTSQRQFLLKPSQAVKMVFRYCAAYAAAQTGVELHGLCVMSNHYHCICTDPDGRLPKFTEILHKLVAKCLNTRYDRWESLWSSDESSYVRLETPDAVLQEMVYVVTNPVEAGLVSAARDWPGELLFKPGRYLAKRPEFFFAENGKMPRTLELTLTAAPIGVAAHRATDVVESAVRDKEKALRAEFKATGRRFLGARFVKAQAITDSPNTRAPRRNLSPRIAVRDKWRRIEALQRLKEFAHAYKEALTRWQKGERDVAFPAGVYAMRVIHNVRCAPALA